MNCPHPNPTANAIQHLLNVATGGTGGSPGSAAVLLSAYNIYEYSINLDDLCLLDDHTYECAMMVMRLRACHGIEPHTYFSNGDQLFRQLAEQWPELRRTPA